MSLRRHLLLSVGVITLAGSAFAQNTTAPVPPAPGGQPGLDAKGPHDHPPLSPEEREKRHDEMREKWEHATPEEREKMRAEHRARVEERMKNMTPEQREKFKEHLEERHEHRKEEHPNAGGHEPGVPPAAPAQKGQ